MPAQPELFAPSIPDGFEYRDEFISAAEEQALLAEIKQLEFSQVVMRGAVAKRRTTHFGWTYGYYARRSEPGPPLPDFLLPLRARSAGWAGISDELLVEALITEYPPGATIGWHRDAPVFGDIVAGISLLTDCRMKFRPYASPGDVRADRGPRPSTLRQAQGRPEHRRGTTSSRRLEPVERRRTTHEIELAPRSGYLMAGAARKLFEHSIPAVLSTRYSITFRTLRAAAAI